MERKGFDDLFHLRLNVYLRNGVSLAIEKLEKIHMEQDFKKEEEAEYKEIYDIPDGTTLDSMMNEAEKIQGDNFHKYSGYNNNCQDFVMALLKGSNIGTPDDYNFVKQDTKQLFEKYGYLTKIMDKVTDIGGIWNEIIYGSGFKDKSILNKIDMKGKAIMRDNELIYSPEEKFDILMKSFSEKLAEGSKRHKDIEKEKEEIRERTKKATLTRLKKSKKKMSGKGGGKGSSSWIEHVKDYAKNHGCSYKEAMKGAKSTYKKN
jgi:hypothetical protein